METVSCKHVKACKDFFGTILQLDNMYAMQNITQYLTLFAMTLFASCHYLVLLPA